jgi:C-8 sterol isomerase
MAPQASFNGALSSQRSWATSLSILATIIVLLSVLIYYLDSHLEDFYIFTPPQLHDLSLRAIGAHGNDTRAVVAYIVGELSEKLPGGYVNLDEEWIFNNAGGAMGAMYIIHASKLHPLKRML